VLVSGARLLSTLTITNAVNRDTFAATYLAQGCLENIRNHRDTNWLQNKPWHETESLIESLGNEMKPVSYEIFTQFFIAEILENTETTIEGTTFSTPSKIRYTCHVSWRNQGGDQSLQMRQILTSWRKK